MPQNFFEDIDPTSQLFIMMQNIITNSLIRHRYSGIKLIISKVFPILINELHDSLKNKEHSRNKPIPIPFFAEVYMQMIQKLIDITNRHTGRGYPEELSIEGKEGWETADDMYNDLSSRKVIEAIAKGLACGINNGSNETLDEEAAEKIVKTIRLRIRIRNLNVLIAEGDIDEDEDYEMDEVFFEDETDGMKLNEAVAAISEIYTENGMTYPIEG